MQEHFQGFYLLHLQESMEQEQRDQMFLEMLELERKKTFCWKNFRDSNQIAKAKASSFLSIILYEWKMGQEKWGSHPGRRHPRELWQYC